MKKNRLIFLLIFQFIPFVIFSQSPYKLDKSKDLNLVIGSLSTLGIGFYFDQQVEPFTMDQIIQLNRNDINSFDRPATTKWAPYLSSASDALLLTVGALPALLMTSKIIKSDYKKVAVLYFETMTFSLGANFLCKGLFKRTRPFVYNSDAPKSKKTEADARKSLYSGHTALAFAGAVFTAKVFSDYYPASKWKNTVWITSLTGASTVGYLRFASGKHFPSDIFIGAVAGSLAGYLIPYLHRNDEKSINFFTESSANFYYFNVNFRF